MWSRLRSPATGVAVGVAEGGELVEPDENWYAPMSLEVIRISLTDKKCFYLYQTVQKYPVRLNA